MARGGGASALSLRPITVNLCNANVVLPITFSG